MNFNYLTYRTDAQASYKYIQHIATTLEPPVHSLTLQIRNTTQHTYDYFLTVFYDLERTFQQDMRTSLSYYVRGCT